MRPPTWVLATLLTALLVAVWSPADASPATDRASVRVLQRYGVSSPAVRHIVKIIERVFPRDPVLFMALIGVESAWKPWAVSSAGAIGLAQVMPRMHGPDAEALYHITINLSVGASLLEHLIQQHGVEGGLRRYNGSGPDARRYVVTVLEEYRRLGGKR